MCYRAVYRCFFVFESITDQYENQEICDVAVFFISFFNSILP